MPETHLTLELLRAVHRGDRDPGEVATLALYHLLEICPHCQEAFDRWRRLLEKERSAAGSDSATDDPSLGGSIGCDRESTRGWIDQLLGLPEEERLAAIRRQAYRPHSSRLAELLLKEAQDCLPDRLRQARAIAGLARSILQHGSGGRRTALLYARAAAEEGNAARALGDVQAAEDLLESARFLLAAEGCDDAVALAELDVQEASLRRYQGRLGEAEELLSNAAAIFAMDDHSREAARALIALGIVYNERHEFERAIEVTRKALELLEAGADARILLCARHNLAQNLVQGGHSQAAREVFDGAQALYEKAEEGWSAVYRQWLGANLSRAEGDLDRAESGYRAARQSCLAQGMEYRAAVVGKDLAALYGEQGRLDKVERLVEEIIPVFEAQNVHFEIDQALRILEEARASGPPPQGSPLPSPQSPSL